MRTLLTILLPRISFLSACPVESLHYFPEFRRKTRKLMKDLPFLFEHFSAHTNWGCRMSTRSMTYVILAVLASSVLHTVESSSDLESKPPTATELWEDFSVEKRYVTVTCGTLPVWHSIVGKDGIHYLLCDTALPFPLSIGLTIHC